MASTKRIVCLANSRKPHGRCIAGREHPEGEWLRPVSAREGEEVSERERQYDDGSDPRVLDILDIPLLRPNPDAFQTENWLLDPKYYWERVDRLEYADLVDFADNPRRLWVNGDSTYHGVNDQIAEAEASGLSSSLKLLFLEGLRLHVFAPGERFGDAKRRVHGEFTHRGLHYRLWVTDPLIEREYLAKQDGHYELGACYATVSLSKPYKGYCYKLVAAVILPGGGSRRRR